MRMRMMMMRMRMMTEVNWISGKNKDTQKISFSWQKNMVLPIKYKNRVPIFWWNPTQMVDPLSQVRHAAAYGAADSMWSASNACDSDVFFLEVFGPSP